MTAPAIERDMPLRLSEAVQVAFPRGGMTVSGLRREAAAGRLVIEKIAGKHFTTLAAIERMRELCRVERKAPASGSSQPDQPETDGPPRPPSGISSTAGSSEAQERARAKLQKLKKRSEPTSTKGQRRVPASVTPLPSRSPT